MTIRNVADLPAEHGTRGRISDTLLSLPVVEPGRFTEVTLPAYLDRSERRAVGYRIDFEHQAPPHHVAHTLPMVRGGQVHHRLILSPGGIQISTSRRTGWERRDEADTARLRSELVGLVRYRWRMLARCEVDGAESCSCCSWSGGDPLPWYESYREYDRVETAINRCRELLGVAAKGDSVRGEISSWSAKSQRRMQRRIASFDWETFHAPGHVPAMVTLTYPGDWLGYAPNGAAAKRHLRAFRAWYSRRTDGLDRGLWKLEFQGRGAPHFHLFLLVPDMPHARRGLESFADECRLAWWNIIRSRYAGPLHGPFVDEHPNPSPHAVKHLRTVQDKDGKRAVLRVLQGVSIDLHEGAKMLDPARIASYFSRHGRSGGKEYQHIVPTEWVTAAVGDDEARVGRWWGYWRMDPVEVAAELSLDDVTEVRRLLRSWVAAQGVRAGAGAPVQPRAFSRSVPRHERRIDFDTGEIYAARERARNVNRRYRVATMSHPVPTGYLLVNDAPGLIRQIARFLAAGPDWPPGARRPLP